MNSISGNREGLSNNTTNSSSSFQHEEIPIRPINYLSDDYLSNILHSIQSLKRNHSSTTNPISSSSSLVVLRGGIFSHMIYSLLSKYWVSSSSILKTIYKEEQRRNNHQFSSSSSTSGGGDQESTTNQNRKQDILNSFEKELKSHFISILSSHSSKLSKILRSSSTLILLKELKFWHFFKSFDDEIILRGFYF